VSFFEDLKVWQKAKDLSVRVHKITRLRGFDEDPELKENLRRASIDAACLIADGSVRGTGGSSIASYLDARGLLARLDTLAELSLALGCVEEKSRDVLRQESETVAKMLSGLIKAQRNQGRKNKGSVDGSEAY